MEGSANSVDDGEDGRRRRLRTDQNADLRCRLREGQRTTHDCPEECESDARRDLTPDDQFRPVPARTTRAFTIKYEKLW